MEDQHKPETEQPKEEKEVPKRFQEEKVELDEDYTGTKKDIPAIKQDPAVAEAIKNLMEDEKNQICADTGDKATHASITFGVFLSDEAAKKHIEELGIHRSLVKNLATDNFDEFQLKCLHWDFQGGNRKWNNLCKNEKIHKKDWKAKYCSYVGRHRTKILFLGASGQKTQDELKDLKADEERDAVETAIHYALIVDRLAYAAGIDSEKIDEGMQKNGKHLGDKFIEFGHASENAYETVKKKIEEEKVNEKMQRAGRKTGDKLVNVGKASVHMGETTKNYMEEHKVNEKADRIGKKSGNAFVSVGKKATAVFTAGKAKAGKLFFFFFRAENEREAGSSSDQRS